MNGSILLSFLFGYSIYALLTKMAGYWPSPFFSFYNGPKKRPRKKKKKLISGHLN